MWKYPSKNCPIYRKSSSKRQYGDSCHANALFASAVKHIANTSLVHKGDRIVITGGSDVDGFGETDTMKVYTVDSGEELYEMKV